MKQYPFKLAIRPALVAALAGATVLTAACSDPDANLATAPAAQPAKSLGVSLQVSSLDAPVGQRVAVAIVAQGAVLGGLQGRLTYDPSTLRYVGQDANGQVVSMVSDPKQTAGHLSVVTMDVRAKGLPERTAVLNFEVLSSNYAAKLGYRFAKAGDPANDVQYRRAQWQGVVVGSGLAASETAKIMSDDDVARVVDAGRFGTGKRPMAVPGALISGTQYGDCNLDGGAPDVFDVLCTQRVAADLDQMISGTDVTVRDAVLAANVFPANLPGAGEIGDAVPPGLESGSATNVDDRVLDVFDALDIANDAAGNNRAIPGTVIPGRETSQFSRPVVTVTCPITTNTNWTRGNIYRIQKPANPQTQVCNVGSNDNSLPPVVLSIEAGTRIESDSNTIVIGRNAQIQALGTLSDPIVFTCGGSQATPTTGCWGGLYIDGNAPINNGTATSPAIPGRNGGGAKEAIGEGNSGSYGGDNPNDNSGTLRFVVVEFAGTRFSTTNERNGITLQGVGAGTTIDYVMSDRGLDDGIEWFGGTVNVKHAFINQTQDDGFDWVGGWRGKLQFGIVRGCTPLCDRGIEADNFGIDGLGQDPEASPRAAPIVYNVTLVGDVTPSAMGQNNQGIEVRQNTAGTIRNFLAFNWKAGLDIDSTGIPSGQPAEPTGLICRLLGGAGNGQSPIGNDSLSIRNGFFAGNVVDGDGDASDPRNLAGTGAFAFNCGGYGHNGSDLEAQYIAVASNKLTNAGGSATTHLVDPFGTVPDFRVKPSSSINGAVCATPPSDGFFDVTATYCGAMPYQTSGGGGIPWYAGWTNPR